MRFFAELGTSWVVALLSVSCASGSPVVSPGQAGPVPRDTQVVEALPVVARAGTDVYGYPRSYLDRAKVRSMLWLRRYAELSHDIEHFQREAARDYRNEYFINDAAISFETADPELGPELDAWVAATPASFAPYLARAAHLFAMGFASRGTQYARDTPAENFARMNRAFGLAWSDLDAALRLAPDLAPALRYKLRITSVGSTAHANLKAIAAREIAICPACFRVRVGIQYALAPVWGGSYSEMAFAARDASPELNPKFKLLWGYAEAERAHRSLVSKNLDDAQTHIEAACALGDNADFLDEKADILRRRADPAGALRALDTALDQRPQQPDLLFMRARLYSAKENPQWLAAYADLSLVLRLDPANGEAHPLAATVSRGLAAQGWEAHIQGREDEALGLMDEAAALAPDRDVKAQRAALLTSEFHGSDAELSAIEATALAAPHDFAAHERLDYALSTRRAWPRISGMWATYIAANPRDGRAYFERAGTLLQLGDRVNARTDALRACDLGIAAGCLYGHQL